MLSGWHMLTAYAVALAAGILGSASLVMFAAFLWTGSFELVDLRMTEPGMLAWDAALCLVFFLQHSVMLRKSFQLRMCRRLPDYWSGVTYTIASAIALIVLVSFWQRADLTFYVASASARWLFGTILLIALAGVLWGIRSLGDFDGFGMQRFLSGLRGTKLREAALTIKGPYRVVRHPFYAFAIGALWAAPVVTLDRIVLNAMFTVWIVLGAALEERDLVSKFGEAYKNYQRTVPMFVPAFHGHRRVMHRHA